MHNANFESHGSRILRDIRYQVQNVCESGDDKAGKSRYPV